jgi:predicted DNA-binding ribbon-helix-helix protein
MKSTSKRSIVIRGHATSISLENAFWEELLNLAKAQSLTVGMLVAEIDAKRDHTNLSSAIRLHILEHFRQPRVEVEVLDTTAALEVGG